MHNINFVTVKDSVLLTPELAEFLYSKNTHNRPLNRNAVMGIAEAIKRGEWRFTGEAIKVLTNGDGEITLLIDGQKRCKAVLQTGISIPVLIVDVSQDAQKVMDSGEKRSFAGNLSLDHEKNAHDLAATVRKIWAWEQDGVPALQNKQVPPTTPQLYETLHRHPSLRDFITRSESTLLTKSLEASHRYIFGLVDAEDAENFFYSLDTGENLKAGSPILVLRKRLIESQGVSGLHVTVKSFFLHKSFRFYRNDDTFQRLTWKAGYSHPDRFPIIQRLADGSYDFI